MRTVVEINGRRYDTETGKVIKDHSSNKSVDGVVNARSHSRKSPSHQLNRKVQKSKTLMRSAVHKPGEAKKRTHLSEAQNPKIKPHKAKAKLGHNSSRYERAKSTSKSSMIYKFGDAPEKIAKSYKPLEVTHPPKDVHHITTAKPTGAAGNQLDDFRVKHKQPKTAEEHFAIALAKADSHTKQDHKKNRRRTKKHTESLAKRLGVSTGAISMSALVLAFLALGVFYAYLNSSYLSLQLASSRAGFSAKMPKSTPSGFSMGGPIEYGPGFVAINFESNADDRNFKLTEKVSNWNSQALAYNFLDENGKEYQTYQDKGRTIYIYDGANATWVNGGVWYQLSGNSNFNTEQILNIASSL